AARLDKRMAGWEGRGDHRICATIAALGGGDVAHALMNDAKVVERSGEIGIRQAEVGFLAREGGAQMVGGADEVAFGYRLLGCIASGRWIVARIRHRDVLGGPHQRSFEVGKLVSQ